MSSFGFLSKLNFLQDIASWSISKINPAIIHNVEKYNILKKVHYLSSIEGIEGDYLEFGVFTGSSFCHSIRCSKKLQYLNNTNKYSSFFGFDSFEGFGDISDDEKHPFYTDENFKTSFESVNKRVKKVAKDQKYKLIKGFFEKTLQKNPSHYKIEKAKIIFIDSDTYSSSRLALNFCKSLLQNGTFIILDDFFSYKGNIKKGVSKAFYEFIKKSKYNERKVFTYGMGGVVFVLNENSL
tara:strand:+ start:671 stop:1384 length:714 start_codon:yes stop_codon:yes gene_type:complete